jgi:hypothetical protein
LFLALIAAAGLFVVATADSWLPDKYGNDARLIRELVFAGSLWDHFSFDSYINTARIWWAFLQILEIPERAMLVASYALFFVMGVHKTRPSRQDFGRQLLFGLWMICSAIFLAHLSKEFVAIPLSLFLCFAGSRVKNWLACLLILGYAAFFRQYWAIVLFYYFSLRLLPPWKSWRVLPLLAVAYLIPFFAADALGLPPLSDARLGANLDRFDAQDARTAFGNFFSNTGWFTDAANSIAAWFYLNFPLSLALGSEVQYQAFAALQFASVLYFVRGVQRLKRGVKSRKPDVDAVERCASFVIAYSATLSIFEPDFGSFVRHQIVIAIPALYVAFAGSGARRRD